jgi:predicted nuclease with TOPRIM domain
METQKEKSEIENRLQSLEMKLKNYQNDFEFLKFEKRLLENRILNLKNKIFNLQMSED